VRRRIQSEGYHHALPRIIAELSVVPGWQQHPPRLCADTREYCAPQLIIVSAHVGRPLCRLAEGSP
jgi:hypothetical protein